MRFIHIFLLSFQRVINIRSRSFVWFLLALINPLVTLLFWTGVFKEKGDFLPGWSLPTLTSYYFLIIIAASTLIVHVEEDVALEDIREGGLSRYLLRPIAYFKVKLYDEAPYRLLQGFFGLVVLAVFYLVLGNFINIRISPLQLFFAIIITIVAFVISFTYKMILGLTAFWFTDIRGLQEFLEVTTIVLAGFVIPIDLFPNWLKTFSLLTPFPYIIYFPVQSFLGRFSQNELIGIVFAQITWLLVLSVIYKLMWNKGVRKFTGVGQ